MPSLIAETDSTIHEVPKLEIVTHLSHLLALMGLCAWIADDEEEETEMIEGVPEPEMINIPGLGPLPIRRPAGAAPAGMGERLVFTRRPSSPCRQIKDSPKAIVGVAGAMEA